MATMQLTLPLVSGETRDALSGRLAGVDAVVGDVGGGVGGCVGTGGGGVAVDIGKLGAQRQCTWDCLTKQSDHAWGVL